MNVARILYPVNVLGPGRRIGVWLAGCDRACPGCSNPELWERRQEYEISVRRLLALIEGVAEKHPVDGFTITGGEPMNQAEELSALMEELRVISGDILVYTGGLLEEIRARGDVHEERVLAQAAVLIDGSYVETLNDGSLLRGSSNQRIHILNAAYEPLYREYLRTAANQIQNFSTTDGVVSVGIHRKTF